MRLVFTGVTLVMFLCMTAALGAQDAPLTPKGLEAALDAKPAGEEAGKLAERIRALFGREAIKQGASPKVEDLTVAVAIEAPGATAPPRFIADDLGYERSLIRLGDTGVYALVFDVPDGAGGRYAYAVDGKRIGAGLFEVYRIQPDSLPHPNVPKGVVTQMPPWKSRIFEGTTRDWWIYVPAQYKAGTPACVMVFQDGGGYRDFVPTVLDNLIAKGDMPVTVAVMVNPGAFEGGRSDRSFEYDTLSDQYARFLLEEILPEVEKTYTLRHDPESRAIAGASSGGICAFTVAWERPDQFHRVLSWIGSFTGIASGKTLKEGGNNYPVMIRKTPRKPLRIFLQDGRNDLDNEHGNWPLANQEMARALAFKGYDYTFVFGYGSHSGNHGRAILPDSLRWLWRGYKPE